MKIRQATVCSLCRSRKLGCDGKRPACTQCLFSSRKCPGYQTDVIFRPPQGPGLPTPKNQRQRRANSPPQRVETRSPSNPADDRFAQTQTLPPRGLSWPLNDVLSLCIQSFVPSSYLSSLSTNPAVSLSQSRICGAWVEVLPLLLSAGGNELLPSAIRALGLALVARGRNGRAPIPDAIEAQCLALNALQRAICHAEGFSSEELAAAIMCLFLSETMLPTSNSSTHVHGRGIGEMIQLRPPSFYASGVPHKLFVGFRPVLVLHAFRTRTSSFLAASEWQEEPFHLIPATPLQALMSIGSEIPSILEALNHPDPGPEIPELVARSSIRKFVDILNRLDEWYQPTAASSEQPLWWPVPGTASDITLSFPNISVANSLTHFWAFSIICMTHITQLRSRFPALMDQEILVHGEAPESRLVSEEVIELSVRILQSVEYLVQDEMQFYGIASVAFPLHTAWEALDLSDFNRGNLCVQSGRVVQMIVQKGYEDVLIPCGRTIPNP